MAQFLLEFIDGFWPGVLPWCSVGSVHAVAAFQLEKARPALRDGLLNDGSLVATECGQLALGGRD
jgi:hypothetical protein